MFFWHLVLKVLPHNSHRCNQQKCYIETIVFRSFEWFVNCYSFIITLVWLSNQYSESSFFYVWSQRLFKIVQLKTQFDMYFDSYRQIMWRHLQILKCYIFINFVVLNILIKSNYLLKVYLWKSIKFSFSRCLKLLK